MPHIHTNDKTHPAMCIYIYSHTHMHMCVYVTNVIKEKKPVNLNAVGGGAEVKHKGG